MITAVEIHGLRGVRSGEVRDMTPLTVLVGPCGSGKSTVLEALAIAGGRDPLRALQQAVQRRPLPHGARWLVHGGPLERHRAEIAVALADGGAYRCELLWLPEEQFPARHAALAQRWGGASAAIEVRVKGFDHHTGAEHVEREHWTLRNPSGVVAFVEGEAHVETHLFLKGIDASLVDGGAPLHELFSRIAERGRRQSVVELVRAAIEGLQGIEVLSERERPRLHLMFADRSVPIALAGDGAQRLVRLCLEVASRAGGTLLVEDPEAHLDPAGLRQSARALAAGARAGVQAVVATHSGELVEALVQALGGDGIALLSLHRLTLAGGEMKTVRVEGGAASRRLAS